MVVLPSLKVNGFVNVSGEALKEASVVFSAVLSLGRASTPSVRFRSRTRGVSLSGGFAPFPVFLSPCSPLFAWSFSSDERIFEVLFAEPLRGVGRMS